MGIRCLNRIWAKYCLSGSQLLGDSQGHCCVPPPRPQGAHGLHFLAKQACFLNKQCVFDDGCGWCQEGSGCARSCVPKEILVFTEDANYCLQPIIICLLPVAHWSKVLITLAPSKKLVRKKDTLEFQEHRWLLFYFLAGIFGEGFLRLEVAKEGNAFGFWFCFLMPHMAVLLTGKAPTVNWMMLYSHRANLIASPVAESTRASEPEPYLPHLALGRKIKAAFPLFCWPEENIVAFHAGDVELFKQRKPWTN